MVTGIVTGEHESRKVNQCLRTLLEATGRFTVKITEEFRGASYNTLGPYDLVLINYDGKQWPNDKTAILWGEQSEKALFDFVRSGKGLVIYHSSIWVDPEWPEEYERMIGGCCCYEAGSRRSPNGDLTVNVVNHTHPITTGLDTSWKTVNDDLFAGSRWHPEAQVEILASVFDDLNDYRTPNFPPAHHPVNIPGDRIENMNGVDNDQAVAWTNRYGEGRVFVITIGHDQDTIRRHGFVSLFCRGVEWAATGKVTIQPPSNIGENRLCHWPFYG